MNKTYKYGMKLRGFSLGNQPMKGILYAEDGDDKVEEYGRFYHSILYYSRPLSKAEMEEYELDDLNVYEE